MAAHSLACSWPSGCWNSQSGAQTELRNSPWRQNKVISRTPKRCMKEGPFYKCISVAGSCLPALHQTALYECAEHLSLLTKEVVPFPQWVTDTQAVLLCACQSSRASLKSGSITVLTAQLIGACFICSFNYSGLPLKEMTEITDPAKEKMGRGEEAW